MAWSLVVDPVFYTVSKLSSPGNYFYAYQAEMVIDSVFQYAVLVELGWSVLRPIKASLPKHSVLFLALLITLAGAVIWPITAWTVSPHINLPAGRFFAHLLQTFAALRVTIFVALAGFSQLLSIGWRHREMQIATGLGFYSMISLAVALIHTHQAIGPQYRHLDQLEAASYVCSLVYWIVSFAQQEEERQEFTPRMQSFLLTVTGAARGARVALANSGVGSKPRQL